MANNIDQKTLQQISEMVRDFIEHVEESTKYNLEGHILLTAREDAIQLVFSEVDKLYDAPLSTMPIIILKKIDGLFEPVFNFYEDKSAKKGLLLFADYLKHLAEDDEDEDDEEIKTVGIRSTKLVEEFVSKAVDAANDLDPSVSKTFLTPKGRECTAADIDGYFHQTNLLGDKSFDYDYSLDDYMDGIRAEDLLHTKPIVVSNIEEFTSALLNFKRTQGYPTIKSFAQFLGINASTVWEYCNKKRYPNHKKVMDIITKKTGIHFADRKEVK